MFNGIASFFGFCNPNEETEEINQELPQAPARVITKIKAENRFQADADSSDEEWMVVGKRSPAPNGGSGCIEAVADGASSDVKPTCPPSPNSKNCSMSSSQTDSETKLKYDELSDQVSDTLSDMSSLPDKVGHPSMCESWLVTPPPCFNLGGNEGSSFLAVGPLENLLIEHPSMSVYQHHTRGYPHSTGYDSDQNSQSSNEAKKPKQRGLKGSKTVTKAAPCRPNAVAERAGLLAQAKAKKSMQTAKQKVQYKKLSKKALQRENKAKHIKSSQKKHSRKQYMNTTRSSGLSNNRKTNKQ